MLRENNYTRLLLIRRLDCSIKVIDVGIRCSSWHFSTTWHSTAWHSSAWHTTWHSTWCSTGSLINLHHDWIELSFELLLLGFIFFSTSILVAFKELKSFCRSIFDGLFVLIREFLLEFFIIQGILHLEAVVFKSILSIDLLSELVVLIFILFSILNHLLNFFF